MNQQQNVCPSCGRPLEAGAMFCGFCGAPIQAQDAEETVYVPRGASPAAETIEPWQDAYYRDRPDAYGGAYYPQEEQPADPYSPYQSDPLYAPTQSIGSQDAGRYDEYPAQQQYQPRGDYGYNTPQGGYAQQSGYAERYYPEEPAESEETRQSKKNKKIVMIVLCIAGAILIIEGVLAYLYLNDITSSFFPVRDVIELFTGDEDEDEQAQTPEESTTQAVYEVQQGDSTTTTTTAEAITSPNYSGTTTTVPEPITAENSAPENLQPYIGNSTQTNRLYVVNTQYSNLNLREQPTVDADIIEEIPKDTVVNVQYVYGVWGYVEYRGKGGWASMNYLAEYN